MKHPAKIDISLLILFFNRADVLEKVFEQVRLARPSRLFFYQDGPRGDFDMPGIEACRRVVENIDWECEVHTSYQEVNQGCDPSEFLAVQWAFSYTDKLIMLEDDDVPTQSFFPYCKELLDRYEHDERIGIIQGCNCEEVTEGVEDDYFFSNNFNISGWASWRRVFEQWEEHYDFLSNPAALHDLELIVKERGLRKDFLPMCRAHKAAGKAFYESIFFAALQLNNQLAIVPTRNQVLNIGIQPDSAHFSGGTADLPPGYRRIFEMERYELEFPLKHPRYIMEHIDHRHHVYRIQGWNHPWIRFRRSLWELGHRLRKGDFGHITKAIKNRLHIIFKGKDFV
ncbi:MAG: hemolysin activation protein [Bacteroidaceae bacterium]|nr:hemolysin activation protein [Bacteroidaceae bacterium]